MSYRGTLIALEGCDRVGKSTQCKLLLDALGRLGIKAESLSYPVRATRIGRVIDSYLRREFDVPDKAVHLLFAVNRWETEPLVRNKLNSGITLILDRYYCSGVAYSAAKEGMDLNWCVAAEIGLPKPDLIVFLDLPLHECIKRNGFGDEKYESYDFQKKVYENYQKLKDDSWKMISADQDVDSIHKILLEHAQQAIERCKSTEIGSLEGFLNI